ncbi:hypothetical protein [Enterococcus hirae]|uniref:hypothetical protein n=1 Tax=Enterococcus hirae TaxID=1354 RepID=UPI0009BC9047|nr:hypothetical protein [Enterococcus hirae]EME5971854.1 hypothetical protein [Enterococcus faecium]OQO33625.1 hypothetical protein BH731_10895 [Enterococcus hirae]OQO39054.1 hypothetical protein BH738_02010 [Enterococcus hirae]
MNDKVIEILSKSLKKEEVNAKVIGLTDDDYKTIIIEMEKKGLINSVIYSSNVPFYFEITEKGKSKIS